MFKLLVVIIIILYTQISDASEWLCKEEASQRRGDDILACGIGTAVTEASARLKAFDSAQTEFNRVCDASSECRAHSVTATPQRTDCEAVEGVYTCYRLVVFAVSNLSEQPETSLAIYTPPSRPKPVPVKFPKELGKPFTSTQIGFETHLSFFSLEHCEYGMCLAVTENGKLKSLEGYKP